MFASPTPFAEIILTSEEAAQAVYGTTELYLRIVKFLNQQASERLEACVTYDKRGGLDHGENSELTMIMAEISPDPSVPINWGMILMKICEILYMRDILDEDEWMRIQEILC